MLNKYFDFQATSAASQQGTVAQPEFACLKCLVYLVLRIDHGTQVTLNGRSSNNRHNRLCRNILKDIGIEMMKDRQHSNEEKR